ncbi:sigma-70 family RNA polymerase sigma factor [Kitasatospora sp. NPDC050543]|uniref:sigma-70 family RNA polymerase sigma factor n=1 Tax=Kitasatospora sp. NPDC050543 TaxID=3364054 RepID=UPI0037AC3C30
MPHRLSVSELRPAFAALATALAHRHRLDVRDLEQSVWLRLYERAAGRGVPRDAASWLRALTLQEFRRLAGPGLPSDPVPAGLRPSGRREAHAPSAEDQVLAAQRRRAVAAAVAALPGRCPELLTVLAECPELSYRQLAARLGLPRGSIGPTRSRCLSCLRTLLHGQRA